AMESLMKMCRVCMREALVQVDLHTTTPMDDKLSEYLKKTKEPEPTPAALLKDCSAFPVASGDTFPQKICERCIRTLRDAFVFKRRYRNSIENLRRVKKEAIDQEMCAILENEDWSLNDRIKTEKEEVDGAEPKPEEKDKDAKQKKPKEAMSFKCADCTRIFTGKAQLTRHSRTHSKGSAQNGTRPKRQSVK
ncbi:hypothetical protein KR009_011966, partial [Drosophila setifemur]